MKYSLLVMVTYIPPKSDIKTIAHYTLEANDIGKIRDMYTELCEFLTEHGNEIIEVDTGMLDLTPEDLSNIEALHYTAATGTCSVSYSYDGVM